MRPKTPRQLTLLARTTMNKVDQEPRVLLAFSCLWRPLLNTAYLLPLKSTASWNGQKEHWNLPFFPLSSPQRPAVRGHLVQGCCSGKPQWAVDILTLGRWAPRKSNILMVISTLFCSSPRQDWHSQHEGAWYGIPLCYMMLSVCVSWFCHSNNLPFEGFLTHMGSGRTTHRRCGQTIGKEDWGRSGTLLGLEGPGSDLLEFVNKMLYCMPHHTMHQIVRRKVARSWFA